MLNTKVLIVGIVLLGIGTGGVVTYNNAYNSSTTVIHEETKNETTANRTDRENAAEKKNKASEQLRSGTFEKTPDDGKRLFHEFSSDSSEYEKMQKEYEAKKEANLKAAKEAEKKNKTSGQLRSGTFEKTPNDGKRLFHEFKDNKESERLKNKADERMKRWKEKLKANREEAGIKD